MLYSKNFSIRPEIVTFCLVTAVILGIGIGVYIQFFEPEIASYLNKITEPFCLLSHTL